MLLLAKDTCARLHTRHGSKEPLLIHSLSDSCFGSDCFMPGAGNKSVNTTDNIPTPYVWSASLGKTEKGTNTAGGDCPREQ